MPTGTIICPACGYAGNIEGEDACNKCGVPLIDLTRPKRATPIERSIHSDRIETLAPRTPFTVSPQTTAREALRVLVDRSVGCLLVVDGENLAGIFTERDALMKLSADPQALADRPISEFMTASPETLARDDKIAFALHKMDLGGFRHIPILADGKPTGIISVRDILRYVTDHILPYLPAGKQP